MHKKTVVLAFITVCVSLHASAARYDSVRIEGLKLLSKKFILSSGAIVQKEKGYRVDKDLLAAVIKKEKMIKDFKLIDKNDTLWINVVEKTPVLRVIVSNNNVTRVLEIDESLEITSLDAVYLVDAPTVILNMTDLSASTFKGRSREFLMKLIRERAECPVWNEISSIDIHGESDILVRLRGRPTSIECGSDAFSLKRINALVGYMDKVNYYPDRIHIEGTVAVIK
jgi:hypothetical protein